MKRTATDDGNGQSKLARASSREEYCKMLEKMLNEYDAVSAVCSNSKIRIYSKEKKQARDRMNALTGQLQSTDIFVLNLIQSEGSVCASEKFLTKEEAEQSEEAWKQIPLMKTLIFKRKVGVFSEIRPLLQIKIVDKPKFRHPFFCFAFHNGFGIMSACIKVDFPLFDELIGFLEEKKKNLNFVYWVLYDIYSYSCYAHYAGSKEDFKLKFEQFVTAKPIDQ